MRNTLSYDYTDALSAKGYRLKFVNPGEDPVAAIRELAPVAVCYQFDYPEMNGLADMRLTKRILPSTPVLMITQAHSEQLAVWAFRSRVWDYFVEPVDTARLLDVIATLATLGGQGRAAVARTFPPLHNLIPPEGRLRYSGKEAEESIVDQTLTFLDANLHRKIVQADVARYFGLSTFKFSRLFKRLTQVTFQEYLLSRRIEEAKRLLANPKVSVTDVCFTVGFQDLSYFTRIFQRYVGLPPSRFRQSASDASSAAKAPHVQAADEISAISKED